VDLSVHPRAALSLLAGEPVWTTILEAMVSKPYDSKQYSVLLAEDDDALRDVLGQVLSSHGWHVHAAASGSEALTVVQKEDIDFSILDLHMPGLSGIETLQLIRQEVKPLPCIFISGQATKEEQMQALAAGAFSFLYKPVGPEILRHAVQRLIHRHFTSA
jgi:CheY-like chemotaxis protein